MGSENFIQIIVTAIIQGITEFLPVSSSGHILFVNKIFNWSDSNLTLAVAVHFGTLVAVIRYFWIDVKKYFIFGLFEIFKKNKENELQTKMLINIIISTLPIVFVVFFFTRTLNDLSWNLLYTSSALLFSTCFFAIILFISDKTKAEKKFDSLSISGAFFIGIFQIFALIPGSSRAGVCISAARFLGYNRISATKYSMYLSIPTILGATLLINIKLINNLSYFSWVEAFLGFILSFIFAFFTIDFFLKILKKISLTIFVIYRILLAILIFVYIT